MFKEHIAKNINASDLEMDEENMYCAVCGKEISTEECESYDGLCWECWDDQMTEECEFEEKIISLCPDYTEREKMLKNYLLTPLPQPLIKKNFLV